MPYAFAGSADGSDFSVEGRAGGGEDVLLIGESGRAVIAIETGADVLPEGDDTIELVLGAPDGAALGGDGVHRLTLREANVAPRVTLSLTQGGEPVARLRRGGAPVRLVADVVDPNPGDAHALDWSASDPGVLAEALVDGATLVLDPATLAAGSHAVVVRASDDGDGQLRGEARTTLVVVEPGTPPGTEPPSGLAPDTHPERDTDGDRVPDAHDIVPQPWLLASGDGGAPLQGDPGHRLVLGATALAAGRDGARLDGDEPGSVTFDIEVHDVVVGGLARLVLPIGGGIPDGARLRVASGPDGWRDFSPSLGEAVASLRGARASCPGTDEAGYAPGLGNGDHCLRLALLDGGANDADARADGVVRLRVARSFVDALPVPAVIAESGPPPAGTRFSARGERVVLAFALRTDHVDAELDGLSLETRGTLDGRARRPCRHAVRRRERQRRSGGARAARERHLRAGRGAAGLHVRRPARARRRRQRVPRHLPLLSEDGRMRHLGRTLASAALCTLLAACGGGTSVGAGSPAAVGERDGERAAPSEPDPGPAVATPDPLPGPSVDPDAPSSPGQGVPATSAGEAALEPPPRAGRIVRSPADGGQRPAPEHGRAGSRRARRRRQRDAAAGAAGRRLNGRCRTASASRNFRAVTMPPQLATVSHRPLFPAL